MQNQVLLGIDVGEKRVGVSMAFGEIITPIGTFPRAKAQAEKKVLELIEEKSAALLVVGLPLDHEGNETQQCDNVRKFCTRLSKRTEVPIELEDEYSSSLDAKQRLQEVGNSNLLDKKRGIIDALSASIILQSYLERQRSK